MTQFLGRKIQRDVTAICVATVVTFMSQATSADVPSRAFGIQLNSSLDKSILLTPDEPGFMDAVRASSCNPTTYRKIANAIVNGQQIIEDCLEIERRQVRFFKGEVLREVIANSLSISLDKVRPLPHSAPVAPPLPNERYNAYIVDFTPLTKRVLRVKAYGPCTDDWQSVSRYYLKKYDGLKPNPFFQDVDDTDALSSSTRELMITCDSLEIQVRESLPKDSIQDEIDEYVERLKLEELDSTGF